MAVVGPLEGVRRGAVVAIYRVGGRRCGCGGKMGPACGLGGKVGIYVCEERKAESEIMYMYGRRVLYLMMKGECLP